MGPLVSIITANYNKEDFIAETVASVIAQTHSNWELIIVDDCSTDNSVSVVQDKFPDPRIRVFTNGTNRGANFCRNAGILEAKGKYIMFLDGDDILTPDCLEKRAEKMEASTEIDFCVFTMGVFNAVLGDSSQIWKPVSSHPLKDFLSHALPWSILQPIWRADLLRKVKGFDEAFYRLQDVELHTRVLFIRDIKFEQVTEAPDCFYRIGEARRNYNTYTYNLNRVTASLQYFQKFYQEAKARDYDSLLLGTIYETYLQCIFHTRYKQMTKQEFGILEARLLDTKVLVNYTAVKRTLFKISRFYHFHLPRIPGVNMLMTRLILL